MHIFSQKMPITHKRIKYMNSFPSSNDKISTIAYFAMILAQWPGSMLSNIPMIYF